MINIILFTNFSPFLKDLVDHSKDRYVKETLKPFLTLAKEEKMPFSLYMNQDLISFLNKNYKGYKSSILEGATKTQAINIVGGILCEPLLSAWYRVNLKDSHEKLNAILSSDFYRKQPEIFYHPHLYNTGLVSDPWFDKRYRYAFIDEARFQQNGYNVHDNYDLYSMPFKENNISILPTYSSFLYTPEGVLKPAKEVLKSLESIAETQTTAYITLPFVFLNRCKILNEEWLRTLMLGIENSPNLQLTNTHSINSQHRSLLPNASLNPITHSDMMQWLSHKSKTLLQEKTELNLYKGGEIEAIFYYHEAREMYYDILSLLKTKKKERPDNIHFSDTITSLQQNHYLWYAPNGGIYQRSLRHEFYQQYIKAFFEIVKKNARFNDSKIVDLGNILRNSYGNNLYNFRLEPIGGKLTRFFDFRMGINYCASHQDYPETFRPTTPRPRTQQGFFQDFFLDASYSLDEKMLASQSGFFSLSSYEYSNYKKKKKSFELNVTLENPTNSTLHLNKNIEFSANSMQASYYVENQGSKAFNNLSFGVQHVLSLPKLNSEYCQIYLYSADNLNYSLEASPAPQKFENIVCLEIILKHSDKNRRKRTQTYTWDSPCLFFLELLETEYYNQNLNRMTREAQALVFNMVFPLQELFPGEGKHILLETKLG